MVDIVCRCLNKSGSPCWDLSRNGASNVEWIKACWAGTLWFFFFHPCINPSALYGKRSTQGTFSSLVGMRQWWSERPSGGTAAPICSLLLCQPSSALSTATKIRCSPSENKLSTPDPWLLKRHFVFRWQGLSTVEWKFWWSQRVSGALCSATCCFTRVSITLSVKTSGVIDSHRSKRTDEKSVVANYLSIYCHSYWLSSMDTMLECLHLWLPQLPTVRVCSNHAAYPFLKREYQSLQKNGKVFPSLFSPVLPYVSQQEAI